MAFKYQFSLAETLSGLGLPDRLVTAVQNLQQIVRLRFGIADPNSLDQYVSRRDLVEGGLVQAPDGVSFQASGKPAFYPVPVLIGETTQIDTPTQPTGLTVTGAATNNILMWDAPGFAGFAYTEVWKNSVDNLGTAVLARTTTARVAADNVGGSGITRYYWIRHVNQLGDPGPYNDTAGTAGTTGTASGPASTAAYDALVVAQGVIVSALIGDAEIGTAKIADAAITNAKITSLAVSKLSAGALAVGQYIQSSNWGAGTGWKINEDGTAYFNAVYVSGEIHASNFTGTQDLSAATLTAGEFIGTLVRNAGYTTFLYLAATGTNKVLQVGSPVTQWDGSTHSPVEILADGSAYFANPVISRPVVVASGTLSVSITLPPGSPADQASGP